MLITISVLLSPLFVSLNILHCSTAFTISHASARGSTAELLLELRVVYQGLNCSSIHGSTNFCEHYLVDWLFKSVLKVLVDDTCNIPVQPKAWKIKHYS